MPTKDELEAENAELRAQVAALAAPGRSAQTDCTNSCPHGLRYHGGPICMGDLNGNWATPCACPEHPDDPPIPAKWVA